MLQQRLGLFLRGILPLCFALAVGADAAAQTRPMRVVSLNLCTDQLLLALADREQIASLSYLAHDRSISYLADRAAGLPVNEGKAEAILFEGAALVLTGIYGQQSQADLLRRQGFEVLSLGHWTSLAEGRGQIRTLARRLGHPERGEALIGAIDAALDKVRGIAGQGRSILAYDRGGWVSDTASPLNEILALMGFRLHQTILGLSHGGPARLEALVSHPPDYLVVDEDSRHAVDNGTALFVHPALVEAVPMHRRLVVPGMLTICGGPATPAAIEALAAEVRAKVR